MSLEKRNTHNGCLFRVCTCSGVMKAVDLEGKLRPESLLEEVGKRASFAFSKKRARLESSLEAELADDKRGSAKLSS